jgi:hypothetical protein
LSHLLVLVLVLVLKLIFFPVKWSKDTDLMQILKLMRFQEFVGLADLLRIIKFFKFTTQIVLGGAQIAFHCLVHKGI